MFDMIELRFNPGRDWCQQVREGLTSLTEDVT